MQNVGLIYGTLHSAIMLSVIMQNVITVIIEGPPSFVNKAKMVLRYWYLEIAGVLLDLKIREPLSFKFENWHLRRHLVGAG